MVSVLFLYSDSLFYIVVHTVLTSLLTECHSPRGKTNSSFVTHLKTFHSSSLSLLASTHTVQYSAFLCQITLPHWPWCSLCLVTHWCKTCWHQTNKMTTTFLRWSLLKTGLPSQPMPIMLLYEIFHIKRNNEPLNWLSYRKAERKRGYSDCKPIQQWPQSYSCHLQRNVIAARL